jgi:hypothetical protein
VEGGVPVGVLVGVGSGVRVPVGNARVGVTVAAGVGVAFVWPRNAGKHCVLKVPLVAESVRGTFPTGMLITNREPFVHWYTDPGGKPAGTALLPSEGSVLSLQLTPDLISTSPVAAALTRHPGLSNTENWLLGTVLLHVFWEVTTTRVTSM